MPTYGYCPPADLLGPPPLPAARGPVTEWLFERLRHAPRAMVGAPDPVDGPLEGDDSALALYCLYELHYRGFAGVDDRWEWEPSLLAVRAALETAFTDDLGALVGALPSGEVVAALREVQGAYDGPSLSRYAAEEATADELRELAVHRSAWQLKEADPHTWAIPRLAGAPKAALVEIQADEYGDGVERDMHQTLFALTLAEMGLDPSYGAYLDLLPARTLATVNLVSMFGLHRRWRGALAGHLATFEMTSVEPMGNYAAGLRRLGWSADARHFYEAHVVADAHHSRLAADGLVRALVAQEPDLAPQVLFGAAAVSVLERRFADHALRCFAEGSTSLRAPLPATVPRPTAVAS